MPWGENLADEVQGDDEVLNSSDEDYDHDADEQADHEDSDSDPDPEPEGGYSHEAETTSEKRRLQHEIFKAFAAKRIDETTEKEIQETIKKEKDEELSIQMILNKQGNSAQITSTRDYQTELFLRASEENIIAVLDTGTGKTHIATLLLRRILDQELEDRAKGTRPKMAFFLVSGMLSNT